MSFVFCSENIILGVRGRLAKSKKAVGGCAPRVRFGSLLERFFDTRATMAPVDAYLQPTSK